MKKFISVAAVLMALQAPALVLAHEDGPPPMMEKAISKLPPREAEDFRDTMRQAHEDNKDLYEQAKQLHWDMHNILIARDFDKDAFISKSNELRQVHEKIGMNMDQAFAEAVNDLSPRDRMQLAHAMEKDHKMHKNMKHPMHDDMQQ